MGFASCGDAVSPQSVRAQRDGANPDGWLLPPEARLDRALCLALAGQRDAARRILLRTGDTRFEDAIDRLLEKVAGSRDPRP